LALLALLGACDSTSDPGPAGEPISKAGSSVTNVGCLAGMANAMSMVVHELHFRTHCSRNDDGKFVWAYMFKEKYNTNEESPADTVEKCIDELATHLNDHIPYMEISLTERCAKRVKMFNGDRLVWAFDYRGH
jgi:hypothetical protein